MPPAIQTRGLTRLFRGGHGVSDLDLHVPAGCLYGFLGPNGAGKTTTVRLLLDLLRPERGEIELFGQPLHRGRREALALVGSLVESPSLYPHLSGVGTLTPLEDQHLGGAIMLLVGGISYLAGGLWLTAALLRKPVFEPGERT